MKSISLAHSPDSDDAFMFYGLARGDVRRGGLEIAHVLQDIESLNREAAARAAHEVTAISFHAYPYVADRYALMPCGGSIGDGYGPLLVAREPLRRGRGRRPARSPCRGRSPRAYLALQLFAPGREHARGAVRPHPGRGARGPRRRRPRSSTRGSSPTAARACTRCWTSGAWWKDETGLPLPLGGNAVRRDLGPDLMARLTRLVRETVRYSLAHRAEALAYAMELRARHGPGAWPTASWGCGSTT